jgi:peptide-methionine (R)-S-oxide reductase
MNRRIFLAAAAMAGASALIAPRLMAKSRRPKGQAGWQLSDAEWRKRLSSQQYFVQREAGTERPFSHPLDKEKRKGRFMCAGCRLPLFDSSRKFDSGTGWPSFWAPLPAAVGTMTDYDLGYPRTEVHCRRCGGHLGHVFDDGPKPTGQRYCMNGAAMLFAPVTA